MLTCLKNLIVNINVDRQLGFRTQHHENRDFGFTDTLLENEAAGSSTNATVLAEHNSCNGKALNSSSKPQWAAHDE